jgi:hypothetical protein
MYQSKRWHAVVIKYHGGIFAEHHDDGTTSESGAHVILFRCRAARNDVFPLLEVSHGP